MAAGLRQNFGRYVSRESVIHGLDPFAKIFVFALMLACILLCLTWASLALVAAFLICLCLVSRVSLIFYLGSLKYFSWMFALSFAINVIFPRESAYGAFSPEALDTAGIYSVRLGLMILAGTLFTVTTAPHEIGDSLLAFTGLKGRVGRRVADLATILSIALRFIPVMFEEAERIRTAQMLRGQRARGLRGRVRAVVNLIVPLFQSSLRKAASLGFALESRCYGYMVPRTEGLRFGGREVVLLSASTLCLVFIILLRTGTR
jgi:energy-coupling factor transport system permease protein